MKRCPVHDELYEEGEDCPKADLSNTDNCLKHTQPKIDEKRRVLAAGGNWDDAKNKAVET